MTVPAWYFNPSISTTMGFALEPPTGLNRKSTRFRGTSRKLRLAGAAVAGAHGVRRMVLRRAADGSIRWRARGRRVGFSTDDRQGSLDVRLLLADATDPGDGPRCFAAQAFFRPGPRGTLIAE